MTTLYYIKEFVTLHQKNPGYTPGNNAGNPYLSIAGVDTTVRKYGLEAGYGDPGEDPNADFFDYSEWKIAYATFIKPQNFNALGTYETEAANGGTSQHTFRLWSSISVPDDFVVPSAYEYSPLAEFGSAYVSYVRKLGLDYLKQEKLPFASFLSSIVSANGLYGTLSGHANKQMDLIDLALKGKLTPQQLLEQSETATIRFETELAGKAAGLPAPLVSFIKSLVSQKYTAFDPAFDKLNMGVHQIPELAPRPVDLKYSAEIGSSGNDFLVDAGSLYDVVLAGAGNDTVIGNAGNGILIGGSGIDTLDYSYVIDDLSIFYDKVQIKGEHTFTDRIAGFEKIVGGQGNDTIYGIRDQSFSHIDGGKGTDTVKLFSLRKEFAVSWLSDGSVRLADMGTATLTATILKNVETLWFADGETVSASAISATQKAPVSLALSAAKIAENVRIGTAVGSFSAQDPEGKPLTYKLADDAGGLFQLSGRKLVTAKAVDYEKVQKDNVTIEVSDGVNTVRKTFTISVVDITENIAGDARANTLKGGVGADRIFGKGGDDVLIGGKGYDHLWGGEGKDRFVFKNTNELGTSKSATDTIFDFSQKEKDTIDISGIDANTRTDKNDAFTVIGTKAFSKKAGELRFEKTASDTYIYGDTDGDGKADFTIYLDDPLLLKPSDFIL